MDRLTKFREETRNVTKTTTIMLWICGLSTIALFVASFIVPPTGVIDPTILKAAALLFAFATLAEAREAIREGLGVKLTHGHTTIEVHDLDGPEPVHGKHGHGYSHGPYPQPGYGHDFEPEDAPVFEPGHEPENDPQDENN